MKVSSIFAAALGCCVGATCCWLFIHRKVVKAVLTGGEIPEPPTWHPHPTCHKVTWQSGR